MDGYDHTQKSPLCLFIYGSGLVLLVGAWFARDDMPFAFFLAVIGGLVFLTGMAFHRLTVADEGDRLAIRFGPVPVFRRTVQYSDIVKVEVGRTMLLDGWGIHYSVRGGWVWNLWGRDCVVLRLKKGVLRIGTDDAENLARFLDGKINQGESKA